MKEIPTDPELDRQLRRRRIYEAALNFRALYRAREEMLRAIEREPEIVSKIWEQPID